MYVAATRLRRHMTPGPCLKHRDEPAPLLSYNKLSIDDNLGFIWVTYEIQFYSFSELWGLFSQICWDFFEGSFSKVKFYLLGDFIPTMQLYGLRRNLWCPNCHNEMLRAIRFQSSVPRSTKKPPSKGLFGNRVVPNQILVWGSLDPKKGNWRLSPTPSQIFVR